MAEVHHCAILLRGHQNYDGGCDLLQEPSDNQTGAGREFMEKKECAYLLNAGNIGLKVLTHLKNKCRDAI